MYRNQKDILLIKSKYVNYVKSKDGSISKGEETSYGAAGASIFATNLFGISGRCFFLVFSRN